MNELTTIEASTDIALAVSANPGIVLFDTEKFDVWYERLRAGAPSDLDMTVRRDREVLRSYAAEVRSKKAGIDKARLRLTKEWRDMVAQANAAGKVIEERLESLAVEVRRPLTEWEDAEKARVVEIDRAIADIHIAAIVAPQDTAATVRQRGTMIWSIKVDETTFGERVGEAKAAKAQAVEALKAALARLEREEADRAELARLRAEAEERERIEAERVAAEEAERRRQEEARIAEERRIAAERAEAERIERVRREAEENARRAAEQAAQAERDRIQREHDEALAAERRRADEAEAARQAEADRIAREEAARKAEQERQAREQAQREADQKHRRAVKTRAKEAIMSCGASEDVAQKLVLAIIAGEIPAVTLRF